MAEQTTSYSQYESWVGFEEQTTWGTALAQSATKVKFDIIGGGAPYLDVPRFYDDSMRSRELASPDNADVFSTRDGQWIRYTVPEFICPSEVLSHICYAMAQGITSEDVATPFEKVFTVDGTADPDFAGDAGLFHSVFIKNVVTGRDQRIHDAVIESATVRWSADQGGRCTATCTFLTGSDHADNLTLSGTQAFSTSTVPTKYNSTSTLSIDSQDLVWNSFEISMNNVYGWVGDNAGEPDNIKLMRHGVWRVTANVKLDANVLTMLENNADTAVNQLTFTIGSTAAAGYFKVDAPDAYLRSPINVDRGGNENVQTADLIFDLYRNDGGTENITLETADAVDQAWT